MKFKYIGEHTEMIAFGLDFSGGKVAGTTKKAVIAKLQGNSHFEEVTDKPAPIKPEPVSSVIEQVETNVYTGTNQG